MYENTRRGWLDLSDYSGTTLFPCRIRIDEQVHVYASSKMYSCPSSLGGRSFRCSCEKTFHNTIKEEKEEEKIALEPLPSIKKHVQHDQDTKRSQNMYDVLDLDEEKVEEKAEEIKDFRLLHPFGFAIFATRMLEAKEIRILSECSTHLHILTHQRVIWTTLLHRDCDTILSVSKDTEAKRAYHLVRRHIFDQLRCFHTLISYEDDVLGFPIDYTIHPVRKTVDHILAPLDGLLSYKAFHSMCHHKSATGVETRGGFPCISHRDISIKR